MFDLLEPIEHYWAFPGVRRFERARRLFAAGAYDRFAHLVAGLNRELATDSYRRWRVGPRGRGSGAGPRSVAGVGRQRAAAPYFEVLIVDPVGPQQEAVLREELHRLRRPNDEFIYEIVVVPSFEDAVIAVSFNSNLQAFA